MSITVDDAKQLVIKVFATKPIRTWNGLIKGTVKIDGYKITTSYDFYNPKPLFAEVSNDLYVYAPWFPHKHSVTGEDLGKLQMLFTIQKEFD